MIETSAFFLTRYGTAESSFELRTIGIAKPNSGQVLIEVESFGLNYADVMARKGLYQAAPPLPCILGYEVVGKVIATGSDVPQEWLNKRVVGFCRFGGYAKHLITDLDAICEIDTLKSEAALALATQYVTAYYMVERAANVQKNETVLIHAAAGGVGIALIQLCKMKGAHVIAKVSSQTKSEICKKHGADQVIIYTEEDYTTALSQKPDVTFNPIGGSTFKKDLKALDVGGRLVLFGGSELSNQWGILSKINFIRKMGFMIPIGLMMRSKSILGVNMLQIADYKPQILAQCLKAVVQLALEEKINPVSGGIYSDKELGKAHQLLESGKSIGKLSVVWDEK